jgi:VWFA-related protein
MRRKLPTFTKLLPALLFLAVGAPAQDFRLRAKVDLVVVPVTVKDSGGKLISGLAKQDFVVLEDGREQDITNFSDNPVPLSAAIVIDAALAPGTLSKIQKTFSALTDAFSDFDEVAVYRYGRLVTRVLSLSTDRERFETAIKTLHDAKADPAPQANLPGGPFSIQGPVVNGQPVVPPTQNGSITPPLTRTVLNDAIFAAASDLAKSERNRHRIVLVISDGLNSGNDHTFEETIKKLLETDVQVYAVGLDQPFPYKGSSILNNYANRTGGDAYFSGSVQDIEKSYTTATQVARNQYVLGYLSNNEVKGIMPVFRDIDVRMTSRNLKTLHREGYYQYP